MTKQFNFNALQKTIEERNKLQESRQNSGIPGIGNLRLKENESQLVRFLVPFSLGISLLVHTVTSNDGDRNSVKTYICEKNYSSDTQTFCPICQYEFDNKDKKASNLREVKNFLVYSHSNAGKWYKTNDGQTKETPTVNILTQGPGKDHTYWNALGQISNLFGLSGVDIEMIRTGSGLQTLYSFNPKPVAVPPQQPGGPIMQSGSPFNWSLIPQNILSVLPPIPTEPFIVDPFNQDHLQLMNQWGDFYIKAGNYMSSEEFVEPVFNSYNNQTPQQQFQQQHYNPNPMMGQPVQQFNSQPTQQYPQQFPQQQVQQNTQQQLPQQFSPQTGIQPGSAWGS